MKYSLLTTNYNKADTLEKSLDSLRNVMNRLDGPAELVVVDGESTDGSIDLLESYSANHDNIRVIVEASNLGEGRRLAFEAAHGEIVIQHVDTDVWYDSSVVDAVSLFEELATEHDDLVLATFGSLYISHRETVTPEFWPTIGRVEERFFVDRALAETTLRVLPVSFSNELPSHDASGLGNRLKKWAKTSRDLSRVGFSLRAATRYNHQEFSLPKALLADMVAAVGYLDARAYEPVDVRHRQLLESPASWQVDFTRAFPTLLLDIPTGLRRFATDFP